MIIKLLNLFLHILRWTLAKRWLISVLAGQEQEEGAQTVIEETRRRVDSTD